MKAERKNLNGRINGLVNLVENKYYILFSAVIVISIFNLFYKLGDQYILDWDEARQGTSAYEMLKSGNLFVNTYDGVKDYWNLKPPLSFWAVALGYKILGFNSWGLRITSALFALLTILVVGLYVKHKNGKMASLFSMLVLMTNTQYILSHSGRTGDPDSLYIFLFTLAMICMLLVDRKIYFLYFMGFFFSLAFLTKSWHSGAILVIFIIQSLATGKLSKLKMKNWFILMLTFAIPILLWCVMRYQTDGIVFFSRMIDYDLLMRSSSGIEGHTGSVFYYLYLLVNIKYFGFWLILLVLCCVFYSKTIVLHIRNKNDQMIGLGLWIIVPLFLFSIVKTKLGWYILPIFPPLAMAIGILGGSILKNSKSIYKSIIIATVLICFSGYEFEEVHIISNASNDAVQELFKNLHNQKQYKGEAIYSMKIVGSYHQPYRLNDWGQGEALASMLYDGLHPLDGGLKNFKKSSNSLLLIPNNDLKNIPKKYLEKTIAKNGDYTIISK